MARGKQRVSVVRLANIISNDDDESDESVEGGSTLGLISVADDDGNPVVFANTKEARDFVSKADPETFDWPVAVVEFAYVLDRKEVVETKTVAVGVPEELLR